jgi:glycosyltransferase involved in cell wall biosynthesis
MYSLVIPVYNNEGSIPELVNVLEDLNRSLNHALEVVFVVDGSPDRSYLILRDLLPKVQFKSKLLVLSRNFGAWAAIYMGLQQASGDFFAIKAADLQEPISLTLDFFKILKNEPVDVVIGTREGRDDPFFSRLLAQLFWKLYRKLVIPEIPVGGVDIFGCNQAVRKQLLQLEESHSCLVALLFWLGFRRKFVSYYRVERKHGKSAWTFKKKWRYMMDRVFSFTDLPIRLLMMLGGFGFCLSVVLGFIVFVGKLLQWFSVPGYATTILVILLLGTINILGLGLIGSYAWRTYENTKRRPQAVIMSIEEYQNKESS